MIRRQLVCYPKSGTCSLREVFVAFSVLTFFPFQISSPNPQVITKVWSVSSPQGSHSKILMTGRSDRGSYFIPQKITTSEFVYPKKSLLFLAYPKKSLKPFFATENNPSGFFSRPIRIPASFIDQKNRFWSKFQTLKNHSDPLVIKICESVGTLASPL